MTEQEKHQENCYGCRRNFRFMLKYYHCNGRRRDYNPEHPKELILEGIKLYKVPDLRDAAILKITLTLYDHIDIPAIISENPLRCKDMGYLLDDRIQKLLQQLPLPQLVKEDISACASLITKELNNWVWYNLINIYYIKYRKSDITAIYQEMFLHWRHITWNQDGSIDYKQTAINLSSSHRLSNLEKYCMLATYCLEDKIKQIIPPSLFTSQDMDHVRFSDHPLVFYWNCYFTNKMAKMPVDLQLQCIASFMFFQDRVDNWPAKEYFFDCISPQGQVLCLVSLVGSYFGMYQKLLWMKLDESQRIEFCQSSMEYFMENYAIMNFQGSCEDDIISTWFEIRGLITLEQFAMILYSLIGYKIDTQILKTIWATVPSIYKLYAWYYENYECIQIALIRWLCDDKFDFFFTIITANTVTEIKRITMQPFFAKKCEYLISKKEIRMLLKLLRACLPESKDSIQFRRNFVTGDYFIGNCKKLILEDDLDFLTKQLLPALLPEVEELTTFLEYFTKHVLFNDICENLIDEAKFITLDKLLSSFLPDRRQRLEFKRHLVDNSKSIKMQCLISYSSGSTEYMDRLLNEFWQLSSSDYIHEYKKNLILSNDGIRTCIALYNSGNDITKIIDDSLSDADMPNIFKKKRNLLLSMRRM